MIDHMSSYTLCFERSLAFYQSALGTLGFPMTANLVADWEEVFPERRIAAFGPDGRNVFWIIETKMEVTPRHVAFSAANRDAVDAFYAAAMGAGGTDHGGPGVRPEYHQHYYGGFVLDPDGNNVEAVCHSPVE